MSHLRESPPNFSAKIKRANKIKLLQKLAKRGCSAQDMQDEIFRKMSADGKIEIASRLWHLPKETGSDKVTYGASRSKTPSGRHH